MSSDKALAAVVLVLALSVKLSGLGAQTHRLVNRQAVDASETLQTHLLASLNLPDGRETVFRGKTVRDWIEEGGHREDDFLRSFRHFHDPLQRWETAGLNLKIVRHDSSIRWMQNPSQGGAMTGGSWSWQDARRLYYEALTESDARRREGLWADLFRALGQIMHLVVDASVPEHTRNDGHMLGALKLENSYERRVDSLHGISAGEREAPFVATYLSAPVGPAQEVLVLPPPDDEVLATVPVARLIDADRYDGTNPTVTVNPIDWRASVAAGLAEIANANFFSEDTVQGQYPSPTDAGLVPVTLTTRQGRVRRYFSRPPGEGLLPANPLRAECASDSLFQRAGVSPPPYPCTDSLVWDQVAAHMLPRAVGYARAALDYFFRGSVEVRVTLSNPVPGLEIPGQTGIWIDMGNTSSESMEGVFEVHARYLKGTAQERRVLVTTLNSGAQIALQPGAFGQYAFSLPPADATPYYVVVFRGRLGLEENAVVGQVFTVPHVQVVQETYDADVATTCATRNVPPNSETIRYEALVCSWLPTHHRVRGHLITNLAERDIENIREPAIQRIEAVWTGSISGPAPLIIDGVHYPAGVWERQGGEANPGSFEIADPAERRDSKLLLVVLLRGGHVKLTTQLATFKGVVLTSAEKRLNKVFSQAEYHVSASRHTRVEPNISLSLFTIASLGGFPVPTLRLVDQLSVKPNVWRDAVDVKGVVGEQHLIDVFEKFPFGDPAAEIRWQNIQLEAFFPQAPDLDWSAIVVPRPPDPVTLRFWQAFVAAGNPPSAPIALTGHSIN